MFRRATREKLKLRLAIDGPTGSGKTYTALRIASALGGRIAVIDTENRSASKYVGESVDDKTWEFDVCELADGQYSPNSYIQAIRDAERSGYDVLIIDSLSHAWDGAGGALDMVDRKTASDPRGNSFTAWREITPQHRALVQSLLSCKCHLIVTMRSKMEYVLQTNERGKMVPTKIGLKPIQREGVEYEFDIVLDLDVDHNGKITKTRCNTLDGQTYSKPGAGLANIITDWLSVGEEPAPIAAPQAESNVNYSPTMIVENDYTHEQLTLLWSMFAEFNGKADYIAKFGPTLTPEQRFKMMRMVGMYVGSLIDVEYIRRFCAERGAMKAAELSDGGFLDLIFDVMTIIDKANTPKSVPF